MIRKVKLLFLILFIWIALSAFSNVFAATAEISINKTNANVGDKVTVTVSINAATWNLKVSGASTDSIVGVNMDAENQKTTKTYTINTSKAGKYTVTLSGDISDEKATAADAPTKINKSVTVNVIEVSNNNNNDNNSNNTSSKDKETPTQTAKKSSDANLTTLGVKPNEYDFNDFSKNKTTYNVTVPYDVDKLDVQYAKSDKNANVKVTGNTNLVVGSSNKISVVVTAEDGTKKTYTIKVTKLAKEDEKEGNVIEKNEEENKEENKLSLEKLLVKKFSLSPEFSSDIYSYTIDVDMNKNDVEKLELEYSASSNDAKVEIIGNENLTEGENIITIMVSSEKEEDKTIYQIIVNKINSSSEVVDLNVEDNGKSNDLMSKVKTIVISVLGGLIALIVGIIVLIHFREKKLNEEFSNSKEADSTADSENNMFYENKKDDKEILNKINKKKGKHF